MLHKAANKVTDVAKHNNSFEYSLYGMDGDKLIEAMM